MASPASSTTPGKYKQVVVHPLVLLSVVDHYTRTAKDTQKRVVGILLGEISQGKVDITNSYAVPFEEESKENIWYLDHNYHEEMFAMFKKISAREKVVGWYSTGPKIRPVDLEINDMLRQYTSDPIMVIIDVNPKDDLEIPTTAYYAVEASPEEKSSQRQTFVHIPSEVGAYEAEEVGVEHLLRDIRGMNESSLTDQVHNKLTSLKGMKKRMEEMAKYLDNVVKGRLPVNHQIIYNIQNMFNLSPNLSAPSTVKAFITQNNDNMMAIYLSSMLRSVIALHNLIDNKLHNRETEKTEREDRKKTPEEREKEKQKKEQEEKEKAKKAEEEAEKKARGGK